MPNAKDIAKGYREALEASGNALSTIKGYMSEVNRFLKYLDEKQNLFSKRLEHIPGHGKIKPKSFSQFLLQTGGSNQKLYILSL